MNVAAMPRTLQDALSALRAHVYPDQAAAMHAQAAAVLRAAGFRVEMESATKALGDERAGRIDLVARRGREAVAIELDCRRPRRRSLRKLRLFPGYRVVALRGVEGHEIPHGIDAVISLRSRVPTPEEASDKRTVSRF